MSANYYKQTRIFHACSYGNGNDDGRVLHDREPIRVYYRWTECVLVNVCFFFFFRHNVQNLSHTRMEFVCFGILLYYYTASCMPNELCVLDQKKTHRQCARYMNLVIKTLTFDFQLDVSYLHSLRCCTSFMADVFFADLLILFFLLFVCL